MRGDRRPDIGAFGSEFQIFDDGLLELRRDGALMGHVATSLGFFRGFFGTIFGSSKAQPWIWLVVVWADGRKERALEDYPPWSYVAEIWDGYIDLGTVVGEDPARFDVEWVPADLALTARRRLGITQEDF